MGMKKEALLKVSREEYWLISMKERGIKLNEEDNLGGRIKKLR